MDQNTRKSPLISIVMPVFNASSYLEECMNSIIRQTQENWELLAIDDHSTDDSRSIVHHFSDIDPRIQVSHIKDKGIIHALRHGFSLSSGKLITRMDADDVMPLEKLDMLSKALMSKGKGHISTGLVKYFSVDGLGAGYRSYAEWLNDLARSGNPFSHIYKECPVPSPGWMMFREDFQKIGGFEANTYPEDYDLAFRMYQGDLQVTSVEEVIHFWRDHANRASRNDEVYADNSFITLKVNWFLELDYDPGKTLVVWGAGRRGKKIADRLIRKNISFKWISNNSQKIDREIYGVPISSMNLVDSLSDIQLIDSVAALNALEAKKSFSRRYGEDYFSFC